MRTTLIILMLYAICPVVTAESKNSRVENAANRLHDAIEVGDRELAKSILDKTPVTLNMRRTFQQPHKPGADDLDTPLHTAARYERGQIARLLLAKGAKINAKSASGDTPLNFAVAYGHGGVTQVLVKNGAAVNEPNHSGMTPLHTAAERGRLSLASYLVRHGARKGVKDNAGKLPADHAREFSVKLSDAVAAE